MFNAFWSQASLFWLFTNHLDNRLLFGVLVNGLLLLFDLTKGLVFHSVFGSFSDMAGFASMDRLGFVYYEWSWIGLAILQTTKTWVIIGELPFFSSLVVVQFYYNKYYLKLLTTK